MSVTQIFLSHSLSTPTDIGKIRKNEQINSQMRDCENLFTVHFSEGLVRLNCIQTKPIIMIQNNTA